MKLVRNDGSEETVLRILFLLMQSGNAFAEGNLWLFLGIAVAACVLGVEVACIGILIKKFLVAKAIKKAKEEEEQAGRYSSFALVALGMASVPFSAETLLFVLVGLAAVAALVFLALILIFRARGYDFISSELLRELRSQRETNDAYRPVEAPEAGSEAVTSDFSDEEAAERVFASFEENAQAAEVAAEEAEVVEGEVLDLSPVSETETAEGTSPAPIAPVEPIATGDGAMTTSNTPTRIVQIEKQYVETVKEVQGSAPAAQPDPNTEILIEKISTLIDKMDQQQDAASHPAADTSAVAASSTAVVEDEDDEDEDEDEELDGDEDANEDGASAKGGDDEDADDPERFTGNERIIGFDEKTGCYIVAHYRKSFTAKLIQSRPNIKNYYSELKNALLAYKGTKSRISWTADSFHNGRDSIAKINVKTRSLEIYLALDPATLEGTVYRGRDVGHLKKYADTPFQYKLRTPRKFKWAMELVQRTCEEHGLSPIDIERVDYESQYPFEDTDSLVARGLIKEYIREENPASTFELDENHVSVLPEEDDTVIPANANFSWEFDNEMLAQKEPEPVEEPVIEEEPAPAPKTETVEAPVAEQPSVPAGTVIRETTKTTTMRYTEQYYGDPNAPTVYKEYISDEDPFASNLSSFASTAQDRDKPEETANVEQKIETEAQEELADLALTEDETVEEASDGEAVEDGLLSAFENDRDDPEDDEDLDWGIPAALTAETLVINEGIESVDEAEASLEEASEGDDTYEEPAEEYAEGDYTYEETTEEYAEGDYTYEETTEEYAEGDYTYEETAEEYAEGDYTYEETTEEYAEGDYTYEETTEEYAEGDYTYEETTEEYAEEDYAYEDAAAYRPQINPEVALVDVGVLEEHFPEGAEIDLEALKACGLVLPSAKILKISATGTLTKAFTVIADQFSMSAIIAINTTGGDAQQIIRR